MIAMSQIWDLVYSCFGYTPNLLIFFFFIMQFRNLTHGFDISESDSLLFFYKHHRFRCRSGRSPRVPKGSILPIHN